ncbi:MAG TPA: hypothetical protein DCP53_03720 [Elusimicrobia bacterium]|nr:MAG: hypothetical protein A2551_07790 [Elusimicrobia bacterium RIFOXYD2_FULL_34_30]HAM38488.1 hypothetical protein [Elusimicrobiota bacterium]
MSENLVGIDIGGTKILIILIKNNGEILKRIEFPMINKKYTVVLSKISSVLKSIGNFKSIGIGIAGDIDSENGIMRYSPNLPCWKNVKLKKYFESNLRVKTAVDNDANCAAYGSYILDGKRKYKNLITLSLGTGIGGGIIINGNLYRGATGSAGELGHITINPAGPKCSCGNYGCIEAYIGKTGRLRIAKQMGFSKKYLDIKLLGKLSRKGNKKATAVFKRISFYLSIGINNIINVFNPDMITFTGGFSNAWNLLRINLTKELKKRTFKTPLKHVKIIKSNYSQDIGAIGAAYLGAELKK